MNSQQRRKEQRRILKDCTPHERDELKRFQAFLRDDSGLTDEEKYAKHYPEIQQEDPDHAHR